MKRASKPTQLWGGALESEPATIDFARSPDTAQQVWLAVHREGLEARIFLGSTDIDRLWRQLGRIRAERLAEIAEMDRAAIHEAAEIAARSKAAADEAAAEIAADSSTPTPA